LLCYSPLFWKNYLGEDATVIRAVSRLLMSRAFYNFLGNVQGSSTFPRRTGFLAGVDLLAATNSQFPAAVWSTDRTLDYKFANFSTLQA